MWTHISSAIHFNKPFICIKGIEMVSVNLVSTEYPHISDYKII